MKIIISPAKKMNIREDVLEWTGLPRYIHKAEALKCHMQGLDYQKAKSVWRCSDQIASVNYRRFEEMDLYGRLTPALLSYEGIQYQYMAPGIFEQAQWDYVQEHLRILSGFYGILKPLDGVTPYRLEMQAGIGPEGKKDLYEYWGSSLYEALAGEESAEHPVIVNLASREYSKAVEPYIEANVRWINCVFGALEKDDAGKERVKVKATRAKMARGEMVRFLAERQAEEPEEMQAFDRLGYRFSPELSGRNQYTFLC